MSKNLGGIFDDDVIVKQMFSWKMVRSYVTAEAFPPIHARSRLLLCTCDTVRALTLRFRPSSICVQAHAEPLHSREAVSQLPIECGGFSAGRPRTFVGHNGTIFTRSRTRAGCKTSRTVGVRWPPHRAPSHPICLLASQGRGSSDREDRDGEQQARQEGGHRVLRQAASCD
jgi:hypothetical protein